MIGDDVSLTGRLDLRRNFNQTNAVVDVTSLQRDRDRSTEVDYRDEPRDRDIIRAPGIRIR